MARTREEREAAAKVVRPSLYVGDDERWTEKAIAISHEFADAVRPIMEKYHAEGYRVRELGHLLASTAWEQEVLIVLGWGKDK